MRSIQLSAATWRLVAAAPVSSPGHSTLIAVGLLVELVLLSLLFGYLLLRFDRRKREDAQRTPPTPEEVLAESRFEPSKLWSNVSIQDLLHEEARAPHTPAGLALLAQTAADEESGAAETLDDVATGLTHGPAASIELAPSPGARPVALSEAVSDAIGRVTPEAAVNVALGFDPIVRAEAVRPLDDVLEELAAHLLRAADGQAPLEVAAERRARFVDLRISDKGTGLSAEQLFAAQQAVLGLPAESDQGFAWLRDVGEHASRLGATVRLEHTEDFSGTDVVVRLPASLFVDDAEPPQLDELPEAITIDPQLGASHTPGHGTDPVGALRLALAPQVSEEPGAISDSRPPGDDHTSAVAATVVDAGDALDSQPPAEHQVAAPDMPAAKAAPVAVRPMVELCSPEDLRARAGGPFVDAVPRTPSAPVTSLLPMPVAADVPVPAPALRPGPATQPAVALMPSPATPPTTSRIPAPIPSAPVTSGMPTAADVLADSGRPHITPEALALAQREAQAQYLARHGGAVRVPPVPEHPGPTPAADACPTPGPGLRTPEPAPVTGSLRPPAPATGQGRVLRLPQPASSPPHGASPTPPTGPAQPAGPARTPQPAVVSAAAGYHRGVADAATQPIRRSLAAG